MRSPRAHNWCITFWSEPNLDLIEDLVENGTYCYIIIGCMEMSPNTNRPHWHGYVETNKGVYSSNQLKQHFNDNTIHVECRMGTQEQAIQYAIKNGRFIECGEPKRQGKRSDLDDIRKGIDNGESLDDLYEKHFGSMVRYTNGITKYLDRWMCKNNKKFKRLDKEVFVYIGKSGSGKSWAARAKAEELGEQPHEGKWKGYFEPGTQRSGQLWMDGYNNEDVIFWDEFDGGKIGFGTLCQLLDPWPFKCERKGGFTEIHFSKAVFAGVIPPGRWYSDECRRFTADKYQLWRRLTHIIYCFTEMEGETVAYKQRELDMKDPIDMAIAMDESNYP
nr:MAG: replication associated protein [ssDNA virus sp.]